MFLYSIAPNPPLTRLHLHLRLRLQLQKPFITTHFTSQSNCLKRRKTLWNLELGAWYLKFDTSDSICNSKAPQP
jgi:hypothetical protein